MRTSIINADKAKKYRIFYKIVAAAVWIMVWQLTSMYLKQEILLASPVSVIKRLTELIVMGDFWKSVVFSFVRIILGFTLAGSWNFAGGTFLLRFSAVEILMDPLITVIKATPVASFIILPNLDSIQKFIICCFLMVFPVGLRNLLEGLQRTDKSSFWRWQIPLAQGLGKK